MVDATNYVMLELGHPLHAFDMDLLAEKRIVVRRARAGEKMHTLDGIPILVAVPNGGAAVAVLYDKTISDPLTDWGDCLELVRRCYYTVPSGQRIGGCVAAIPTCPGSDPTTGGPDCCPARCLSDFKAAVTGGASDDVAVNTTVLHGDCVAGYAAFVDGGSK